MLRPRALLVAWAAQHGNVVDTAVPKDPRTVIDWQAPTLRRTNQAGRAKGWQGAGTTSFKSQETRRSRLRGRRRGQPRRPGMSEVSPYSVGSTAPRPGRTLPAAREGCWPQPQTH